MAAQLNEVPEIWTGSIFSSAAELDPENFESSRDEIVTAISDWFVMNFDDIYAKAGAEPSQFQEFEELDIRPTLVEAQDINNNPVMDQYNHVIKYLEFIKIPITFQVKDKEIRCEFALRINLCYKNKSKIIAYLHPIDGSQYDSRTIFDFFQKTKKRLEYILEIFAEQYKIESQSDDLKYKINIYNIGTSNAIINDSLNRFNYESLVKNIKKYPVFERAYLDIVSVTHGKYFDTYENYLKNVKHKHNWTVNFDEKKNLLTLLAQRFDYEKQNRICDYSGLTNSADIRDIHSMDRRLIFSIINEF